MKRNILRVVLALSRAFGLFALARALTGNKLRILCYHGSALVDEHLFRPGLFMTAETFERRMAALKTRRYPVVELSEAIIRLEAGTLPRCATVITIDDGWYGTRRNQFPILKQYNFPATLYVASYYMVKQTQVFNVALSYVLWRSGTQALSQADVDTLIEQRAIGECACDPETFLSDYADTLRSAQERQQLLRRVCDLVGFDWAAMESARLVSFMNAEEACEAAEFGVDIQLHTHRHRYPDASFDVAEAELVDNRAALQDVCSSELQHFCYPSGEYTERGVSYLPRLGIETSTTTDPGFNSSTASPYLLRRFLDSETVSDLEFDAEMSGFFELMRMTGVSI